MLISELFLLISIFFLCIFLAYEDLRSAFIFLLLVSPLLHKEVFSLVKWDVLPIRIVMLSLLVTCSVKFLLWFKKNRDFSKIKEFLKDPFLIALLSLWLVRVVSLINSKNLPASFLILAFFSTMVFLYMLMTYLSKRYGEEFVLANIKFYSFVALGTAFIALLQFILDAKFGIAFGAIWRIPGKLSRVGSVFWDVNHYAGFIASIIPIVIGLFFTAKSKFSKILYAFSTVFMTAILLLTNSRSAWIGFAVSLFIISLYLFILKLGKKRLIYVAMVFLAAFLIGFREYQTEGSALREKVNSYLQYRGDSFASHFLLLEGSFAIFESHPVIGGGYGSFFEHFKESTVAATYYGRDPAALSVRVPAHSIWGEVLAETGSLGIFTFSVLVLVLLSTILLAVTREHNQNKKIFLITLCASVVSFLVSGIFYSYNSEFFFIILFLCFIYAKSSLAETYSAESIFSFFNNKSLFHVILISIISFLLIFAMLGNNHLIPWDEAIYAKISKNMLTSKNFLVERWEGNKVWYEKPPLYMWMSSLTMSFLGVNSWGVKAPSALMGFATILLVYFMGKRMFSRLTGLLASIILLTTVHFLFYSKIGMLDVTVTFFMTASLFFYYLFTENRKSYKYMVLSGACCGFAVMTKGVVGFLTLPSLALFELFLLSEKMREVKPAIFIKERFKHYLAFAISFLVVSVPWHLYMFVTFGKSFIDNYIGYHVLKRASSAIEGKGRPTLWYFEVLSVSMRIWYLGLLAAFVSFISYIGLKPLIKEKISVVDHIFKNKALYFLMISFTTIFVVFSSSVSKLIWYIIPVYPVAALIVANFIVGVINLVAEKFKVLNKSYVKSFSVFFVITFGLLYLFTVRNLAYVSDDTGAVAELILTKDRITGTEVPLYYDRIEKPLPLFYSDGPIEAVDYNPLLSIIKNASFDETVVYITKESRYQKLAALFPNTDMIEARGDFVLARVKSDAEILNIRISSLKADIEWIEKEAAKDKGDAEALARVRELPTLRNQLLDLEEEYSLRSKFN